MIKESQYKNSRNLVEEMAARNKFIFLEKKINNHRKTFLI